MHCLFFFLRGYHGRGGHRGGYGGRYSARRRQRQQIRRVVATGAVIGASAVAGALIYKGLSEGPIVYASRSDAAAHLELLYKAGASPNAITIGQNGIVYTVLMTSICRFFNWA